MRGIYRVRPSGPRYSFTWDPQPVLKHLEAIDNSNLIQVAKKLLTIFLLATAHRLQTISLIRISGIRFSDSGVQILITDAIKTSAVNRPQPLISVPYFSENPSLCLAKTLKTYLHMTSTVRNDQDFLFLTLRKPVRVASKQTLGRWVKDVLQAAGIDTSIFKPHSTRHAASSTAHRLGISIDTIRQSAGWTAGSTVFARFYNRPLINTDFATSLLRLGS